MGDRRLSRVTETTSQDNLGTPVMSDAQLEAWLTASSRRRPLTRTLSALEGFLTAVVVGPSLPNPFIPIFAALGLTARAWHNPTPAESGVLGATTTHYNRIANLLSQDPASFAPRFTSMPGGIDPRPWCQGFYDAVDLSRDAWGDMLDVNHKLFGLFLPIFIYCKDEQGRPVLGPPRPGPETAVFIEHEAHKDIAPHVAAIREHHHVRWIGDAR
jgi:yecA family protein